MAIKPGTQHRARVSPAARLTPQLPLSRPAPTICQSCVWVGKERFTSRALQERRGSSPSRELPLSKGYVQTPMRLGPLQRFLFVTPPEGALDVKF